MEQGTDDLDEISQNQEKQTGIRLFQVFHEQILIEKELEPLSLVGRGGRHLLCILLW